MSEIRIGLAGLGRFGRLHASVLSTTPGAVLAAVCDPLESELEDVAGRYGLPDRFTDYETMLAEAPLDCVSLATPEPLHAEMVRAALEHGLHVFVEKPLATDHEEARRVADAAAHAGLHVQVGFVLRFDPLHAYVREQVASGRFGRLVALRAKRNCSREWFADFGERVHPVYETSIHDIDLVLWYTQSRGTRVYAVQRFLSGLTFPDACFALLQLADGSVAMLETSWLVPSGAPANVVTDAWQGTIDAALEVVGTEQTARLELLESGLSVWTQRLHERPEGSYWPELHGRITGALREELTDFVECVRAGRPSDVASLDDAVEGLRIADAVVASAEAGAEVALD